MLIHAWQGGASVNDGAIVTTTAGMDTSDLLEKFGKKAQVGADTESRPWEMVGGVGFDQKKKERAPLYVPPKTRPELTALLHMHCTYALHLCTVRMHCAYAQVRATEDSAGANGGVA